jgi:hypothetical protein
LAMILEKVLVRMATRMVRKSVFPKKAKVMISVGPRIGWKSGARSMPVPSRPNQILWMGKEVQLTNTGRLSLLLEEV